MESHKIDELHYMQQHVLSFCKYWPDDGLLRPKLVANNKKNEKKFVSAGYIFNFILIL